MDKLIKVSRASINSRLFNVTEAELRAKLTGEELDNALLMLPSDDEREFMRVFRSDAPEIARIQRKMSVCVEVEVKELEQDRLVYEYAGKTFEINAPLNSFKTSEALEKSRHAAVAEMIKQGRVSVDNKPLSMEGLNSLGVDELNLLVKITDRFFFQIYAA